MCAPVDQGSGSSHKAGPQKEKEWDWEWEESPTSKERFEERVESFWRENDLGL